MAIENIQTKADLERFIKQVVEQQQLNTTQGIAAKLTEVDTRLKKGGL